jgi:hypothetical protein
MNRAVPVLEDYFCYIHTGLVGDFLVREHRVKNVGP